MRVKDLVSGWMTERPMTIDPDAPAVEAYAIMASGGIRHLPVVSRDRLVGIVSDRDLYRFAPLADGFGGTRALRRLYDTPVRQVMTAGPCLTVDPLATLSEAADLLVRHKISSLPVLDDGRLLGIVTSHDLLRALSRDPREVPAPEGETARSGL